MTPNAQLLAPDIEAMIQTGRLEVPMLPEIANKVVTLSQDPESDAAQLSQLIQSDQALAGHVMRIANSAAYTPSATMVSLQQAITRLGMSLITDIALAASISTKMFSAPGFEQHISDIWKHSLATALWAKEIARAARRNVEATFLCGLLHAIGRPVLLQMAVEASQLKGINMNMDDALSLEQAYQKQIGIAVVEIWQMPHIVCEAIEFFDHYADAPNTSEEVAMVYGAAQFASHMLNPETLSAEDLAALPVIEDLNLYQDEFEKLLSHTQDIVETMETMAP